MNLYEALDGGSDALERGFADVWTEIPAFYDPVVLRWCEREEEEDIHKWVGEKVRRWGADEQKAKWDIWKVQGG